VDLQQVDVEPTDLRRVDAGLVAIVVPEERLTPADRAELRAFLVAAYAPDHADVFSHHDFWGGPPTARVIARDREGTLLAHLGFSVRTIAVGGAEARVAGVGAVATHPRHRGGGLGRLIFDRLAAALTESGEADFLFLECRDAVVGFYAACGFRHSVRTVTARDPGAGAADVSTSNVMVRPLGRDVFPAGDVDLRGLRW
jgi:GNAT superfamily N-acetyltransferase